MNEELQDIVLLFSLALCKCLHHQYVDISLNVVTSMKKNLIK